jgi:alpha-tubulin suppressor-like RCC1 family protein
MDTKLIRVITLWLVFVMLALLILGAKSCIGHSNRKTKIGSSTSTFMINAPSSLTATVGSTSQINLFWSDNSNNEDGFEIERSTDGINYTLLSTLNANTISYSDTIQPSLITYYYRVSGFNTIGDRSAYSNVASTTIFPPEWSALAAGESHSLALTTNGMLWGWGNNQQGQLDPSNYTSPFTRPALLSTDTDWARIVAGYFHTLAIKTNGTLWTWGDNTYGELGVGDTDSRYTSSPVGTDSDWSSIAGGAFHSVGLKTNGTFWSWGFNVYGQLGLDDIIDRYTPTQVGTDSDWIIISDGYNHTLGLKTNGTLWAWGDDSGGQLGDGINTYRATPMQVTTDSDWSRLQDGFSASFLQTLACKIDGTLWIWGGSPLYLVPTKVNTDTNWVNVATNRTNDAVNVVEYYLALKTDGTLRAWGDNSYGQLGLGDSTERYTPTLVGTDSDWSIIAAGGYYSLGRKTNGTIWTWGANDYSQLGLGDTMNRNVPCPLGSPPPPSPLITTPLGLSQITINWTYNSNNIIGFIIERGITNIDYSPLTTLGANTTSYLDTELNPANTYYYRIYAYNDFGNSPYSTKVYIANLNQFAPSSLIATPFGLSQINLTWTDNSNDETGFRIERKLNSGGTYQEIATVNSGVTSWLDSTSISPNTYYYYRVMVYNTNGNGPYSNESWSAISGNWLQISGGYSHTIALKTNNTLWTFGNNGNG